MQRYLVYELGVVVGDSIQAGVAEGAAQPGVSAQRGTAVWGEQTEIHPQDRLHEGQHCQLLMEGRGLNFQTSASCSVNRRRRGSTCLRCVTTGSEEEEVEQDWSSFSSSSFFFLLYLGGARSLSGRAGLLQR